MKKLLLTLLYIALCAISAKGQVYVSGSSDVVTDSLCPAYMRCLYDYVWIKDTLTMKKTEDLMMLEIGKPVSKFVSYKTLQIDSLLKVSTSNDVISNPGKYVGGESYTLFKNHPSGKLTFTDKVAINYFLYEEDIPVFEWDICDSTKVVLGYNVQMARCSFRGRDYVAWFSFEVPVSDGPWKFGGLPGLIFEVSDTKGEYSFSIVGIEKYSPMKSIEFSERQYIKTSRKKYLQTCRRYREDPMGFIKNNVTGVSIKIGKDGGFEEIKSDHKALKYDFMEKDIR